MIKFENVTATFTENAGIYDLTFHVDPGEMVFLMGPTGAGKSTVMRALYKDIPLKKGHIIVDGLDITFMKKRRIPYFRRTIGTVFQDYKLLKDRSVYENVALPLNISGLPRKEIQHRVRTILEQVNLLDHIKELPIHLSGGEQQRIAIARALIKEPKIILADEPTGNLDLVTSDEIVDILESATLTGTAVLMATHNFPLIRPRRKRFIELSDGRQVN